MAVVKEWLCMAHGPFESTEEKPDCPMGCDTVERRFFTAPGLKSPRTNNIDATLESVASTYKLTDMGERAMRRKALKAEQNMQQLREICQAKYGISDGGAFAGFGTVPGGGTYNAKTREITGSGPGATAAVQQFGAQASDLSVVKEADSPLDRAVRIKDPEKLRVADAKAA